MSECRHCKAPIEYRTTVNGRRIPVDPQPVAVVTKRGTIIHGWTVHFSTCPSKKHWLPGEMRIFQSRFHFLDEEGEPI